MESLHAEILPAVREVLRRADKPLSLSQLCGRLPGPFRVPKKNRGELQALLTTPSEGIYEWPRSRFWHEGPESAASAAAIEIAAQEPMPQSALLAAVRKKAHGYPKADEGKQLVARMVSDGRLHQDPPWPDKKPKFTSARPDPERYRQALDQELAPILRKYAAAGITPQELVEEICAADAAAKPAAEVAPSGDLDDRVMATLDAIEPRRGLVVAVYKLRQSQDLAGVSKADFDEAVLRLFQQRRVFLHDHGAPYTLSAGERDELVFDGKDAFYAGIAWREPDS